MSRLTLVKVGGNEVDDPKWTARLAEAVAASEDPVIIVHGGGKEVTELQRQLGAEPEWFEGLRVTTPEGLRAVSMVLSGVVNKRIVAAFITAGADAVGISGEDGAVLQAIPARGGSLGRTGEIVEVRTHVLKVLLESGVTPVVSPVSRGDDGAALNVNADDAASAIASAMKVDRFLLVSNVPAVLRDDQPIDRIPEAELEALVADEVVSGGMIPKVRAGMRAAGAGVPEVRIGSLEMLAGSGGGTELVAKQD